MGKNGSGDHYSLERKVLSAVREKLIQKVLRVSSRQYILGIQFALETLDDELIIQEDKNGHTYE